MNPLRDFLPTPQVCKSIFQASPGFSQARGVFSDKIHRFAGKLILKSRAFGQAAQEIRGSGWLASAFIIIPAAICPSMACRSGSESNYLFNLLCCGINNEIALESGVDSGYNFRQMQDREHSGAGVTTAAIQAGL